MTRVPALQTPADSRKPLAQASCPTLLSLFPGPGPGVSQPRFICGEEESGSCRFICTWIIKHQDFIRAVGHSNCPGVWNLRVRETQSRVGGCQGHMWSISCRWGHKSGQRRHFLHLLFLHQCLWERSALPLSWGYILWS